MVRLNERDSQTIATKLTSSPMVRREVETLQRTWELLDYLPRSASPSDFTDRTLAEVSALGRAQDQWQRRLRALAARTAQVGAALAAAALVGVASYGLVRWAWPDTTARLERDLPLAEHLEEYRAVGTFEFLRQLDDLSEAELAKLRGRAAP